MTTDLPVVQLDVISDVVCPWCIIGYKQVEQALARENVLARLRWHPFELNPHMPPEGQNLREHMAEKYGSTPAQSDKARARLSALGRDLGFAINFTDDSRIVNTFQAHQLLDWAEGQGRQHPLKLTLFEAYFTHGADVSDPEVLLAAVTAAGLDPAGARAALASGEHIQPTREKQQFWTARGISGVPSMVFAGKYLITGAQGADTYAELLRRCLAEAA